MTLTDDTVSDAVVAIARGGLAIIVGDDDRPVEAHLICAAAGVTTDTVAFFLEHGSGLVQVPLTAIRARWLLLEPMTARGDAGEHAPPRAGVDLMQTVDYLTGTSTGISAGDRAATAAALADPRIRPTDLARPGHIIPVRTHPDGILAYAGRSEAATTLCVMAGSVPVAVMTELVTADRREMLDDSASARFAQTHGIPVVSITAIRARVQRSSQRLRRSGAANIPTPVGTFHAVAYRDTESGIEHLALIRGDVAAGHPVLVRLHAECIAGDVIKANSCRCSARMEAALHRLAESPRAVFLYLRGDAGRGLGTGGPRARDAHANDPVMPAYAELGTDNLAAQILLDLGVRQATLLTTTDSTSAPADSLSAGSAARTKGPEVVDGQLAGLHADAVTVIGQEKLEA